MSISYNKQAEFEVAVVRRDVNKMDGTNESGSVAYHW